MGAHFSAWTLSLYGAGALPNSQSPIEAKGLGGDLHSNVHTVIRKSKSVGAVFGLTCSRYQSGEVDWSGKISRCGDEMMPTMLYEAAQSMMHSKKWSWLKAWAMQIARRRGMKKAIVALARRLAVIMHRIWVDGTEFRWTRQQAATAA